MVCKDSITFYGGLKKFRGSIKVGDVFQGFVYYDTSSQKWKRPQKANNNMLPLRRNHVAVLVNTDLVIHGGYDENGVLHESCYSLCLKSYMWSGPINTVVQKPKIPVMYNTGKKYKKNVDKSSKQYKIDTLRDSPLIVDGSPGRVSHHAGCLVVHKNSKGNLKPVSLYDRDSQKIPSPNLVQYEGLYVFGGRDKLGEVKGNLYVLVIGKRPCNWVNLQKYIDSEGPSPSARYGH